MRPPGIVGEVRAALESALQEKGPLTIRQAAASANVGHLAAERTIANMRRSGAIVEVGSIKSPHSTRWATLYELAPPAPPDSDECSQGHGWVDLGRVLESWAR